MSWANRLKLTFGILLVLVLVAALTVLFNRRDASAVSTSAAIEVETYELGTDFAGTVTEQFVEEGDAVAIGDPVLTLNSTELLTEGGLVADTVAYTVGQAGNITLLATAAGEIGNMDAKAGGFVKAGTPLVTIQQSGTRFVLAEFELDPSDFARLSPGAAGEIELPTGETMQGEVESIEVTTSGGRALTEVRLVSKELRTSGGPVLALPGTPVSATVQLKDDGVLSGVSDFFTSFLKRVGL
jgi:multidrug resistance efflux pump